MNETTTQLSNVCRACMLESGSLQKLFASEPTYRVLLGTMFAATSTLNIFPSDGLPDSICTSCIGQLIQAYEFQQTCINSDKQLRLSLINFDIEMKADPKITAIDRKSIEIIDFSESAELSDPEDYPDLLEEQEEDSKPSKIFLKQERIDTAGELPAEENDCLGKNSGNEVEIKEETTELEEIVNEVEEDVVEKPEKKSRPNRRRHPCENCGKTFDKPSRLLRHAKVHQHPAKDRFRYIKHPHCRTQSFKVKVFSSSIKKCETCGKVFEKNCRLIRHLKVHDPKGRPFECDICKVRFTSESLLRRHAIVHSEIMESMKSANKKTNFRCTECPMEFTKQESLSSHMRKHQRSMQGKQYVCDLCSKVFKKMNHLTRHVKTHVERRIHQCTMCDRKFAQNSQLIDHLNRHTGLRPHVCNVCNKGFQQLCTLKDHLRTHSGEQPFLCSECGKAFNNSSNLRQHLQRHMGVKRFACPECPSRFICKGSLKSHMTTHTNEKPYACDECGSRFTKPYSLKKHKRIHTGEKPYACEFCAMKFSSADHVKRHMRTHTGEKPYHCKFCERAFAQSNDLVKHTRSHLGEKIYICDQCPASFRLQTELRHHARDHYKKGKSEDMDTEMNSSCSQDDNDADAPDGLTEDTVELLEYTGE